MRQLAIRAIGEIANPQSAGMLIAALDDREARIRLEAVKALQLNPALSENAEALRDRRDPQREPDEQVRQAAERALDTVFPLLPKEQLQIWADRFKDNPVRRKIVLDALADQQLKARDEDGLATTRHTIGEVLVELKEHKQAAEYFGMALEYQLAKPNPVATAIDPLMRSRMKALLLAKDYETVVTFAGQMIAQNTENVPTISGLIWNEAQRLRDAGDLQGALDLIDACKRAELPLSQRVRDELASIEKEIQAKRTQQNGARPPPGPRSASLGVPEAVPTSPGN
jgi:tetratricopeptide (TPR) repeat protein